VQEIIVLNKRLAQNFGANLFAQFTNVLVQMASVPLFLMFRSKRTVVLVNHQPVPGAIQLKIRRPEEW
jgi:hypothetical protein